MFLAAILVTLTILPVKSYAVTEMPGISIKSVFGWTCACPMIMDWNCGCVYIKPPVE